MINAAYARTLAAYNAEMNRRLFAAASRLSDQERRLQRGAFWGSIQGTLTHILWGDRQWMSRFDNWPRPVTPIKQSAQMIDDFVELRAAREDADDGISAWAHTVDESWLSGDLTWFSGPPTARSSRRSGFWLCISSTIRHITAVRCTRC